MKEFLFQGYDKRVIAAGPGSIEVVLDGAGNTVVVYLRDLDNNPMPPAELMEVHGRLSETIRNFVRTDLAEYYKAHYEMWDWAIYLHKTCKPTKLEPFCKWLDIVIR